MHERGNRKSRIYSETLCIRLGGRTRPLIALGLFKYAMHRIVPVNLRASEMREGGWYQRTLTRSRASRGNTETSADFGCLNITFLVSFVPSSSYDRSISKHPILKPDGTRHGTLPRNEPVGPQRISGDPLVYLAEVAGLVSYTSAISSGKCGGTRKITQDARRDVVSLERTCGNLIPFYARKNITNLH